jgi:competence protein ComEA
MHKILSTLFAAATLLCGQSLATPVNVNTAPADEIAQSLQGIGMQKAQAIVDHREANGPFQSADDLTMVPGVGPKTVERNRDDIRL